MGVEGGQQLGPPGVQGAAQALYFGDGAAQRVGDRLVGVGAASGGVHGGVGGDEGLG